MAATPPTITLDTRISLLAQSFCHGMLPMEISDMIAVRFELPHLLKISLLSQKLHAEVDPILYERIVLDFDAAEVERLPEPKSCVLLLRTLVTSKTAAQHVRRLSLIGDPLAKWREDDRQWEDYYDTYCTGTPPAILFDISSWISSEVRLYNAKINDVLYSTGRLSDGDDCSLSMMCLGYLGLVTKLRDLSINSDYFRFPDFRDGLCELVKSGGFQHLTTSDLCSDLPKGHNRHIKAVRDWDRALLTPFLTPATDSVKVVMNLQPDVIGQLPTSPITRLVLRHFQDSRDEYALGSLLAAMPQLRHLEYHVAGYLSWHGGIRHPDADDQLALGPLFDALYHVENSLECLITSHRIVEETPQWSSEAGDIDVPPFRLRRELSRLRRLTTISIPYKSLLGWTHKSLPRAVWDEILPPSLREITLTDHLCEFSRKKDWTDKSLIPVISSLLSWLAKKRTSVNDYLKFGLFLPRARWLFNESERMTIMRECEKRNITCVIEKRHEDRPKGPRWKRYYLLHQGGRLLGSRGEGGRGGRGRGGRGG